MQCPNLDFRYFIMLVPSISLIVFLGYDILCGLLYGEIFDLNSLNSVYFDSGSIWFVLVISMKIVGLLAMCFFLYKTTEEQYLNLKEMLKINNT